MQYIERAIEPLIRQTIAEYSVVLVTGPRQVGKSTLLTHVSESLGDDIEHVTLDDLTERQLAQTDPVMFFQMHRTPILIDEVQYAPELFSQMKIMVDNGAPAGSFLLTGSQQFRLMELAGESLAGRVAILPLSSLSQAEINCASSHPFNLAIDYWKTREKKLACKSIQAMYDTMYKGSMPAVDSGRFTNLNIFYSSYLQTYIERDVRLLLGDVDAVLFLDFMRSVAARCAQMINVAAIAQDVGIRPEKAKTWLALLERSGVVFFLHPYSNNQLKRTVKAPKLYFHDCGIVAYLTKWTSPEVMSAGAMAGAFMENFVVSEIWKSYLNAGIEPPLYYYRDHDAKEVDIIIECDGELHPIEIKRTASPNRSMVKNFGVLNRSSISRGMGAIICAAQKVSALDSETLVIPAGLM